MPDSSTEIRSQALKRLAGDHQDVLTSPMFDDDGQRSPVPRRLMVIYNPTAGGRRRRKLDRIVASLRDFGCEVHLRETTKRGDAEAFAAQADPSEIDVLVAAGGDGTINEVVNGLDTSALPLAIIPLGTANVLSAEMGLPTKPKAIAAAIAFGPIRPVHTGHVNGRRFTMMAGIGFDAYVVSAVKPAMKKKIGKLAYVWETLAALFAYKFKHFRVDIDGREYKAASAIIANGHYYGGRFVCAPDARLESPDLHVCLFTSAGPWSALRYAVWMALGRLDKLPDYKVVQGRDIRILDGDGEPVQGDGDVLANMPLHAELNPEPLRLVMPA